AAQLAPVNVAKSAAAKVRNAGSEVVEAVREGRRAMRDKEAELHARMHSVAAPLADELAAGGAGLAPDDQILVDGRPVQPGQVIVLRQVRDQQRRSARRARRGA
ncbi:MAG TPA: hypothetical protein PLV68_20215, partial [Ilumatobacteraceae bacterium]|nr:hypothetical protein [Ilumatobacteraceae bacterium]